MQRNTAIVLRYARFSISHLAWFTVSAPDAAPAPRSELSPSLWAAYYATDYVVQTPLAEFVLRVGQTHPAFDEWLSQRQVTSWAFVTACNPRSQPETAERNAVRLAALLVQLTQQRRTFELGVGRDPKGGWSENSVCVLGLTEAEAIELGTAHEQNAVVFGRIGQTATLLGCVATIPDLPPPPTTPRTWMASLAVWFLMAATFLWGATFALVPALMDWLDQARMAELGAIHDAIRPATAAELAASPHLPHRFVAAANFTPIWFCLIRFALVSLILGLVLHRRLRHISKRTWRFGLYLAILFFIGFVLQTYGLQSVSPSMSAFLTTLYVPFTPLLAWLLWRTLPRPTVLIGLSLAITGITAMAFLSATPNDIAQHAEPATGMPYLGEILSALCAVAFAGHILVTDYTSKRESPVELTFCMMVWTTLLCVLPLPFFATASTLSEGAIWLRVASDASIVGGMAFMVLGPTLFSFWAMTQFQRHVDPSRAGLVYALEPVFALLISVGVGREELVPGKVLGGALIVTGNVVAESQLPRPARWLARMSAAAARRMTTLTRRWHNKNTSD